MLIFVIWGEFYCVKTLTLNIYTKKKKSISLESCIFKKIFLAKPKNVINI